MGLDALVLVVYEGMIYARTDYDLGLTAIRFLRRPRYILAAGYESRTI
jgi:hypothetical protein